MKLREKIIKNKINGKSYTYSNFEVTIPAEHLTHLGWKKGDRLIVVSDKENNSITFKKQEEK